MPLFVLLIDTEYRMLIYAASIGQLHMLYAYVKLDYFVCEVVN